MEGQGILILNIERSKIWNNLPRARRYSLKPVALPQWALGFVPIFAKEGRIP